jgi:N-acetylmuramic acid 6-phosphate (MurNAc-6-P) etherase
MYAIAKLLLTHFDFGLRNSAVEPHDLTLVDQAIDLLVRAVTSNEVNREDWTELKRESLKYVGSDIADTVSRIASAMRTPDIALSGLRDAAEKTIAIASLAATKQIASRIQSEIQSIL